MKSYNVKVTMDSGEVKEFVIEAKDVFGVIDFIDEQEYLVRHFGKDSAVIVRADRIESFVVEG